LVCQIENKPWQCPNARNFVGKIAFTISTNSRLQEELRRLKVLTEGLCSTSRLIFKLQQGHEIDKYPTHKELQLLDKTRALYNDVPPYAIISYTWGSEEEELTYQDLQDNTGQERAGYTKIRECCRQAVADGLT
jgi:hypothetical protein